MRLKIISAQRTMTASTPETGTKQNNMSINRRISFSMEMEDYFYKIALETGEIIERRKYNKSEKNAISLNFIIIETDNNFNSRMTYGGSFNDEDGYIEFYLGLKTPLFEKIYNEISSGIIPTHVDIQIPESESDEYNDSPLKVGLGESEYFWDNINHKSVQLDTFHFEYSNQEITVPLPHRSSFNNFLDYLKAHKFETALGIILIIFALKSLG